MIKPVIEKNIMNRDSRKEVDIQKKLPEILFKIQEKVHLMI